MTSYVHSVNGWHQTGLHFVHHWCCASAAEEDSHHLVGSNGACTRQLFPVIRWALLCISSRLVSQGLLHPFPGVLDLLYLCRPRIQYMHTSFIVSWKCHIFWHTRTCKKHTASVPLAVEAGTTPKRRVCRSRLLLSRWFLWPLSASHTLLKTR